jgi:hypothetical protein
MAIRSSLPVLWAIRAAGAAMGRDAYAKVVEFDRKIPLWGVLSMGMLLVAYGWNWVADHEKRLSAREQSSSHYRTIVDKLVVEQQQVVSLKGDVAVLKELLIRIERKLDQQGNRP